MEQTFDIRPDMHVYSSDHHKIGTVENVSPDLPHAVSGTLESTGREAGSELHGVGEQLAGRAEQVSGMFRRDATTQQEGASRAAAGRAEAHSGPEQGRSVHEVDIDSSGTRYFRVKHGGFLGIGSDTLYIPYSAVQSVSGNDVILSVASSAVAAQHWEQKPAGLHQGLS